MPIESDRVAAVTGRTIENTRVFGATPEELFETFADPSALARWWGPSGFTNRFEEFDLRPGGAWKFRMRGPDGAEFPMEKRFLEVVPAERIVLRHEQGEHSFRMSMEYAPEGPRTRLTWRMEFDSTAEAKRIRSTVQEANEQNFDRLEAFLAEGSADRR